MRNKITRIVAMVVYALLVAVLVHAYGVPYRNGPGVFIGHILSLQGPAALPAPGTGTTTPGGTDQAFEVTGGTSPVTVTFTIAFLNKPMCTCNDETAALGACKAVPTPTNIVVTTAATDSFMVTCWGK